MQGDVNDTTLTDLVPFLIRIASAPGDIRNELKKYAQRKRLPFALSFTPLCLSPALRPLQSLILFSALPRPRLPLWLTGRAHWSAVWLVCLGVLVLVLEGRLWWR